MTKTHIKPKWLLAVVTSLLLFETVVCEKIIIFHHMASYSHRVQTWPLAEALAKEGHEVQYISPFYPKEPNANISELVVPEHEKYIAEFISGELDINFKIRREMPSLMDLTYQMAPDACASLFTSKVFKEWLKKNPVADLIIIDNCFAECGTALAYKMGAKYIYFSTVPAFGYEYDTIGFLPEASAIPELETYVMKKPLGFFKRVWNGLESLKWRWRHVHHIQQLDSFVRKELDAPNMPHLEELIRKPNLIFYTGDVISDYPRALPPLFVNIAGIHAKKGTKPLPQEMENFIASNSTKASADDGFIYISLGSMIVSSNLPQHIKQIFFDVIKSFSHIKFLWKWNGDFPKDIPQNLFLSKWYPQLDVLGHPKIRGFVTQAGRPSLMEALVNGVPMITFPIVGDQELNADRLEEKGSAVRLDIANVEYESFRKAVERVLYDSKLRASVNKNQKIFTDRPMTPVETAVWWTHYVLRNEDTSHLRPAGADQYWFVRRQIDVWATLSISICLITVGAVILTLNVYNKFVKPLEKLKSN